MKKHIAIYITVILFACSIQAQTPITFDSSYVSYFKTNYHKDFPAYSNMHFHFAVDMHLNPTDSAKTYTFNKYPNFNHWNDTQTSEFFKWNLPGFTGPSVTVSNNLDYQFLNQDFEPITLALGTPIDSIWTVYRSTQKNRTIKAKIIRAYDSTILDIDDQLKEIELSVFDYNGKAIQTDALNKKRIIMGQKIGFVQTIDFFVFPSFDSLFYFIGYQNTAGTKRVGKVYFGYDDILDFEVGDEFQTTYFDGSRDGVTRRHTIYKCIKKSVLNDSIYFDMDEQRWENGWYKKNDSITFIDTVISTQFTVKRPITVVYPFDKTNNISYFGRVSIDVHNDGSIDMLTVVNYYPYYKYNDSLYLHTLMPNNPQAATYYKGIFGGPFYDHNFPEGSRRRDLVFYKKGNVTWGTPYPYALGIKQEPKNNSFQMYPNPTNNQLNITITDNRAALKNAMVYDALGNLMSVLQHTYTPKQITLNTTNLQAGYYYVVIELQTGEKAVKKILVAH